MWIRYRKNIENPKHRLICIPYAGGGASKFIGWQKEFENKIEVLPIQLPGRENRMGEKCLTDCREVVSGIIKEILPLVKENNFSIFGHSMGGIIGYELAKELEKEHNIKAKYLFVSGSSIQKKEEKRYISHLENDEFIDAVREYGGLDEQILVYPEFREFFVNILRNDFQLVEGYIPKGDIKLNIPIKAYYGTEDNFIKEDMLNSWANFSNYEFKYKLYEGNHFFINNHKEEICRDIIESLNL